LRAIPPKGSIPPNIRGNRGIGNISLGFNIGGFGNKATPKQESGDFKIKGKAPVRTKKEQKISLENIKEGVIVPIHFVIAIKGIYEWLQKYGKPSWNSEYRMKQAKKVAWRHIFDWVKANINLVEFGLIPFENIFLSYFSRVLPNGKYESLGEAILPKLYSGEFFNKLLPDKEED